MFDPHADPHGERTVRSQGAKSAADLILLEKKGRKALEYKDWKAPNQLVRMRSPVQIWVAAPHRSKRYKACSDLFYQLESVLSRCASLFQRSAVWFVV